MINEIRIYVEGGGDGKGTKAALRRGFGEFLSELRQKASGKGIRWNITACGARNRAYRGVVNSIENYPNAFNVLLVDSEGAMNFGDNKWAYLKNRDGWSDCSATEDQCHLMVQTMEAWFLADAVSLNRYYGNGFKANSIQGCQDIEIISKDQIIPILNKAIKSTKKGTYHKIRQGSKLLEEIVPATVRRKSKHCNDLFEKINERLI